MNSILFILILLLPLFLGGISSAVVAYKPVPISRTPYAPPSWVFGVVWTFLYLCIGLASALIYRKQRSIKTPVMILYWIHLLFLTLWFPLFVSFPQHTMLWFVYILFLWIYALYIAIQFYSINSLSTYLFIPYLIWLLCAAYLCYFSSENRERNKI